MITMKILMLIDSIDIGGAETHLINLVQILKKNDIECIVASSGGLYEKELIDDEIEHVKLAMKSKNILSLIKTIISLIKLVKKNKIDIIHSHGRMPAFIGNIVSKFTSVRFITTAHAKVESKSIYKYITTYGEYVISVSEDIKKHIIKEFDINEKKISIIPNGINIEKFKNKDVNKQIVKDLKLKSGSIKIMIVSRMDGQLGQICIDLIKKYKTINCQKKIEILVVGDGNRFDEINEIGKLDENIKILGKRSDIDELLNIANIVVAVSRSALEAMAVGKIVILAGGEGYLGLFSKELEKKAISDNFTGRNCNVKYDAKLLLNDIEKAIEKISSNKEKEIIKYGNKLVANNYSLKNSVVETIKVYKKLLKEEVNEE